MYNMNNKTKNKSKRYHIRISKMLIKNIKDRNRKKINRQRTNSKILSKNKYLDRIVKVNKYSMA